MFKPGDKVRRVRGGQSRRIQMGSEYIVRDVAKDDGILYIAVEGDGESSPQHEAANFDLVEAAPAKASPHNVAGVQPHSQGGLFPYVLMFRDTKRPQPAEPGRKLSFDEKYDTGIIGPGLPHEGIWTTSIDAATAIGELLLTHRVTQ